MVHLECSCLNCLHESDINLWNYPAFNGFRNSWQVSYMGRELISFLECICWLLELTFCFFQDSSNFYLLVKYLCVKNFWSITYILCISSGCCGRVVVGFTPVSFTAYVVSLIPVHGAGIIHTTLYYKECRWLVAGFWFSPYIEVSYSCVQMTKDGTDN